ncbi:MAG: helix-turn-helix domain-containing protein, partial [Thermoplasmata archaeon]
MQISKLSKIFFELSNEYRMEILNILQDKTLSLNDISLQLNLPKSEIYRNLKRLVLIGLIFMNGKNRYELSPIGKVFLLYLKNLKFLEKYHQIFKSYLIKD